MQPIDAVRAAGGTLVALLLLGAAQLEAQVPAIGEGDRIRLTPRHGPGVSGTLRHWRPDTIVLASPHGELAFHRDSVSLIEAFAGRGADTWRGAGIGAAAGGAIGMLAGYATSEGDGSGLEGMAAIGRAGTGGAIGIAIGGVIGAIAGSRHQSDRWRPVPAAAPRVMALPGGRAGAGVGFRF